MKAHFIHGFNVRDGGAGTIDRLAPFFAANGIEVVDHDYGWVGLLTLRWRNKRAVKDILPHIEEGDILLAHSNGCLICWELLEQGAPASAVICIQPAMGKDAKWREDTPVLCLYNKHDRIVSLGRAWAWLINLAPVLGFHGWGAAGRYGFKQRPNMTNWDTDTPPVPARGHSGLFATQPLLHWGVMIYEWSNWITRAG